MSEALKHQIEQNIEQATELLAAFELFEQDNTDENLAEIVKQSTQRQQALEQLFNSHTKEQLSRYPALLSNIAQLDHKLVSRTQQQRDNMAQKVLKQKKNTKATNAYINNDLK